MTDGPSKQVQVQYFALLREQSGVPAETIETSAQTLRQLYKELQAKYGFRLACEQLRVAVDDEFQEWDRVLNNEDKIVLVPPVAGG